MNFDLEVAKRLLSYEQETERLREQLRPKLTTYAPRSDYDDRLGHNRPRVLRAAHSHRRLP